MSYGYDENPTHPSHTSLWIVLAVVLGLLLVCGGVTVLGVARWVFSARQVRSERVAADLAAEQAEEAAAEGTREREMAIEREAVPGERAVRGFLVELRRRREDTAYQEHTSKEFRERRTLAQFRALLDQNPRLRESTSEAVIGRKAKAESNRVQVRVNGPGGPLDLTIRLVRENGAWKVDELTVP